MWRVGGAEFPSDVCDPVTIVGKPIPATGVSREVTLPQLSPDTTLAVELEIRATPRS
jgi:hypothetical protein